MQTLTHYLSNIMSSTLLGLPREIKGLIYFDALSHAANKILALPLSPDIKKINPNGVAAMAKDVQHLSNFVAGLENASMLERNLDELQQTVALMQADNHDEFFDISTRNKKFGSVDAYNGPILIEKYGCPLRDPLPPPSLVFVPLTKDFFLPVFRITQTVDTPVRTAPLANFSSRFGLR